MGVAEWSQRIRKFFLRRGYTCDNCGAELFDYPAHRLCTACEGLFLRPKLPCPRCGRERIADGACFICKTTPPKFKRGISPFVYRSDGVMLVNRMKHGRARLAAYFGEEMARTFAAACAELKEDPLLLLPVPATKVRTSIRGYNPAEWLADSVEEELLSLGFQVERAAGVLVKNRETYKQKGAPPQERAEKVKGAYAVARREVCKDRRVLLVDDMITTGSTGNEIAEKLKKAGAREVYILAVAAAPERG